MKYFNNYFYLPEILQDKIKKKRPFGPVMVGRNSDHFLCFEVNIWISTTL